MLCAHLGFPSAGVESRLKRACYPVMVSLGGKMMQEGSVQERGLGMGAMTLLEGGLLVGSAVVLSALQSRLKEIIQQRPG